MTQPGADDGWDFWIDRGGTFTDVVARTPSGELATRKLLSDGPYDDAALEGIRQVLALEQGAPLPAARIRAIRMGTTVATNALLERTGDRTVLVATAGFADLLRIGTQARPRLFDLDITLPELLHERVVEAPERMAADGTVLRALDLDPVATGLRQAHDDGIRSVAIALLHGHRYPDHERAIADLATDIGFTQVSVSHRVSPLVKLVPRGDTTVVDAYLTPVLRRHVDRLVDEVGAPGTGIPSLQFMQSNGGLVDAHSFAGKDAILSGPAGGVVGMVETGRRAGFDRLIGFDMGGTSTDVTHFDGELERSWETEVAGVRLRTPMLAIHTVAAGGGSILHFDGSRFRVGPDSAGADPGPAAYRRGGPLTVTDANLVLGRIQADQFPAVFGSGGDLPLDGELVRQRFGRLATEVAAGGHPHHSADEVAEGFLRIAVENMANAIKKITVERGHDPRGYALHCFGGAGGQHACPVADQLEMDTVLVHPHAGVLSALGMGLAAVRDLRQAQASVLLDEEGAQTAQSLAARLEEGARAELAGQGVEATQVRATAHVRTVGSDQPLLVDLADADTMRRAFAVAHRARYGFDVSVDDLVIEAVSVEAVAEPATEGSMPALPASAPSTGDSEPTTTVPLRSAGAWHDAPLYERHRLQPGRAIVGPAIITEATGTTVIDDGWEATVHDVGNLVLTRAVARPRREAAGTDVDPILLEVFNNLFMSIAEHMGVTLASTAWSVNIKERLDFSCALFDADGALVANAPHVPVHLGSMGASVRAIAESNAGRLRPGRAWLINDPFNGGTHLPDVTVVSPVFDDAGQRLVGWVASRGHHADIGGRTPGSSPPDSTTIDEEGVVINNSLLVDDGELREAELRELLTSAHHPVRNVEQNLADLRAQIAANETGIRELKRLLNRYGRDVVHAWMGHVQDNAAESVRRVVDTLHDGRFRYPLDNGSHIEVAVRVDRNSRTATVDFTGTSPQDDGNHNAPLAVCHAAVLYVFRTLVGQDIPLNEGCLRALDVIAPPGTIVNPVAPAAVVAGNTEVSQAITDALFGAVGAIAGSQGTMNNLTYGNDRHQNYETICGGTGAGPTFDGASAVHSHMTNTRMTDPEVLEERLPVRVEELRIRDRSGGAGRHPGGDGVVRGLRFLEPMHVSIVSSNRWEQPFGVDGGEPGERGRNAVIRADGVMEELPGDALFEVDAGDVVVIETPGGGGWGAPDVESGSVVSRR